MWFIYRRALIHTHIKECKSVLLLFYNLYIYIYIFVCLCVEFILGTEILTFVVVLNVAAFTEYLIANGANYLLYTINNPNLDISVCLF